MKQLVYQPKGRAREYASWALNIYRGCDHGCTYCYAPSILRMDRAMFHQYPEPRFTERDFTKLADQACWLSRVHGPLQVLLCFTTDPYCPVDDLHRHTRRVIDCLHEGGVGACLLTKGGSRALRDFDLLDGSRDAFATTLTCLDPVLSRRWEPEAGLPAERLHSLQAAHDMGLPTWASLEPVLDPAETLMLIELSAPYVDFYKVGRLNYHPQGTTIDWATFGRKAVALLHTLGKPFLLKEDLRKAMGPGASHTED